VKKRGSKFKRGHLSQLDHVGGEGTVANRVKPDKLIRIQSNSAGLIGALQGKLKIKGNILSTNSRRRTEAPR